MDKENEQTQITENDLSFLEKELLQSNKAFTLEQLTQKVAFKKTSSQLKQEVKIYDPSCVYEKGDLILKEYDEPLLVSSKGAEHFKGSVVLRVLDKSSLDSFDYEMLEVGYSGGGTFRKHIDYMKKTKTQVLLPSNWGKKELEAQKLQKEEDPRLDKVPMTDKDIKKLGKNLAKALTKSDTFFHWNEFWQLNQKRIDIPGKKVDEIKKLFRESSQSLSTTDLSSRVFKKDITKDLFDLYCLSLNYTLEKKHKKSFVFVSPEDWGKWHLKEILDGLFKDLPLSAPSAKIPPLDKESLKEVTSTQKFPLKIYLTWREIISGGIKVPKCVKRSLADFREYTFTDDEEEKDYTVYYYPSPGVFLGLKEFYAKNNVPQGASLTLEKKEPGKITFWLKKSKKKISVPQVTYDPKKDRFSETGEEAFTYSLPNKIIHLERDTLEKLCKLYDQRAKLDLKELLILIFNYFGLEGETLFLHNLRAFHLVDVLKQTSVEDVEKVLLSSSEFTRSEKKKGIFFYTEKIRTEAEAAPDEEKEMASEMASPVEKAEVLGEAHLAIGTIESEVPAPVVEEEIIVVEEEAEEEPEKPEEEPELAEPLEPPAKEKAEAKKKEPPPKKKKKERRKIEGEAAPRRRKGEKRFIEERIEQEEFEMEALAAVKAKREKEAELIAEREKKKKEEYKTPVTEKPTFGIFAEKLKSALDKQDKPKEPKKELPKKTGKKSEKKTEKKTEKKKK